MNYCESEIDLSIIERFPSRDLLRTFMILAEVESVEALFSVIIIPYLSTIDDPFVMFRSVLLEISSNDLSLLSSIVKGRGLDGLKDFASYDEILILVIDSTLACNCEETNENLDQILSFLFSEEEIGVERTSDWDFEVELDESLPKKFIVDSDELRERKRLFESYLRSKKILYQYDIIKPLKWFVTEACSAAEQLNIVETIFQRMKSIKSDWILLLNHMDELIDMGILPHISRKQIYLDTLKMVLRDAGILRIVY